MCIVLNEIRLSAAQIFYELLEEYKVCFANTFCCMMLTSE